MGFVIFAATIGRITLTLDETDFDMRADSHLDAGSAPTFGAVVGAVVGVYPDVDAWLEVFWL